MIDYPFKDANRRLAEQICINYFAMHGTFPDGYDIDLVGYPLCGISLDVATTYSTPSVAKKMIKEIKDYYKNLPLEVGTTVVPKSGRYKGAQAIILKVLGDNALVSFDYPKSESPLTSYVSTTWVKISQLRSRPLNKDEVEYQHKDISVGDKVTSPSFDGLRWVIEVEPNNLYVRVAEDKDATWGPHRLTCELEVVS
jgi:hypothetical protein